MPFGFIPLTFGFCFIVLCRPSDTEHHVGPFFLVHWYHPFWLYYIMGKGKMQYGKLYKLNKMVWYKREK